jgi:Ca-activated chloride channel family protein
MHASSARLLFALTLALAPLALHAQPQEETQDQPRFRAKVDVVTIATVVRDKHGRVVPTLTKSDFTVLDDGVPQPIVQFQPSSDGPISVGLLIDGSGSMRHFSAAANRIGKTMLAQLDPDSDDVALMSFDSRLVQHGSFTSDFRLLRSALDEVENWGASSIYDAIAGAAGVVDRHTRKRRAVVVVTDGKDNWSTFEPAEVARIASTIDVPVYVLAITPRDDEDESAVRPTGGDLGDIARATGGEYFSADTELRQAMSLGRMIEDLRHQYLIAIDPSRRAGLRSLEVRTRTPSLKVRARQWYAPKDTLVHAH